MLEPHPGVPHILGGGVGLVAVWGGVQRVGCPLTAMRLAMARPAACVGGYGPMQLSCQLHAHPNSVQVPAILSRFHGRLAVME